jgi:phage repressor protein C with HTH and peptisase S24 domain
MELKDVLDRVEARLRILGLSAHAASLMANRPDAIRNLKRAVHNGERRGVTTETLRALAPVLQTTAAWLLEGQESGLVRSRIPIVGRVGAGAEIMPEFDQTPETGVREVDIPFAVHGDVVAFEVEGESMWPRYDSGDIIICRRDGQDAAEILGGEAVVRTADGRRYLKRVLRGALPDTYDLESHNAAPIRGVRLEWAAEIQSVVRAPQWRRLKSRPSRTPS